MAPVCAAAAAAPAGVAPLGDDAVVVETRALPSGFEFVVEPAWPVLAPAPDGRRSVRMVGFPARGRAPGEPDLPFAIYRIATPPGARPTIDVRVEGERRLPGIVPAPVPVERRDVLPEPVSEQDGRRVVEGVRASEAIERRLDRSATGPAYRGDRPFPETVARIRERGRLHRQRFVAIEVAPVRFDPAAGELRVAERIVVRVDFGTPAGGAGVEPSAATGPFAAVSSRAFLNHAQSLTFGSVAGSDRETFSAMSTTSELDPTAPVHKVRVREAGIVELDALALAGSPILAEPLSTWKALSRGAEVPLEIVDLDADDLLDGADVVRFRVEPLTEEPKTVLNTDLSGPVDLWEYRDVSDEAIYFVTVDAAGPRARVGTRDATPTMTRVPAADFEATVREEVDDAWRPLGGADPWYWLPTLTQGGTTPSREIQVALPGLASPTAAVTVRANLRGVTESTAVDPDHRTTVELRNGSGQTLAVDTDDGTFDGREIYLHEFGWSHGGSGPTLTDPARVWVEASPGGSASHQVMVDWVEIDYRRSFQAIGDVLEFTWPDGDAEFSITGFADSDIEVWELTDAVDGTVVRSAVRLDGGDVTGSGPFAIRFRVDQDPGVPDGTARRYVAFSAAAATTPVGDDLVVDTVSDLRDTTNQADLIVIAHPDVLDDPAGCSSVALDALLAHRATQGITSRVACIEDVQDEFNHGHPGPEAIRGFLRFVLSDAAGEGWADPKPSMVLLLGDATYDTRGGTAAGEYVPTQILFKDDPQIGYYSSDNELATVLGDDRLADAVVGRVPARNVAQADAMLEKLLDYEVAGPAGGWRSHALFVSDRGKNFDSGEALEFERINDEGEALMARPPYTSTKLRYWTDYGGTQTVQIRQDIKDEVNGAQGPGGAAIMQYIGHGNFDLWSDDVMFCGNEGSPFCPIDDTDDLSNGLRLPWLLVHNCLTGGFHTTSAKTMGESWIRQVGGGSVGVYAPSGLGFRFIGEVVTDDIWTGMFGNRKERNVGTLVLDTQLRLCGQNSIEACQYYVFLGDPASVLQLPDVAPPTDPDAVGGNAQVTVSWTASATAGATYDVYRSLTPTGSSTRANASPIAGTSYVDTGVQNATEYYYHVVATDPAGFESRWSNFNSDCAVDGPDCVRAEPLNPFPPAPPTGVQVVDPETGGALEVSWSASPEDDVATYTVEYSTTPGCHADAQCTPASEAGLRGTATVLRGLADGTTYYVVVLATNTSGLTSDPSDEVAGTPTFVRGIKAPATIADLTVDRSGDDAVLSWSAVVADIYGKPETVDRYEIYRGSTPDFAPDPANRIASIVGTSYTDVGAAAAAAPAAYWKVRAVDVDGNGGGLGRPLPDGIGDLEMARAGVAGEYVLNWTPVTTDFDGNPTSVDRYEIYVSDQPFGRAAICDPLTPACTGPAPRTTTTASSITLPLGPADRYVQVFVVDTAGNLSPY